MAVLEMVLTVMALLAVALAVLLFQRKRAHRIERDLKDQAVERRRAGRPPDRP